MCLLSFSPSGQEEYEVRLCPLINMHASHNKINQRLRPMSYAHSHVILIAFALDTPDSLENVTTKVRSPFVSLSCYQQTDDMNSGSKRSESSAVLAYPLS
jgi:hypothetical protein